MRRTGAVVLAALGLLVAIADAQPRAPAPGAPPRPILIREIAVEGNRRVQEAVPVQDVGEAWLPRNAWKEEAWRRPHVLIVGSGTRSDPARGARTPCTATPSR